MSERTDAMKKLAEVSPFWAGALSSCMDQGFDAQGARAVLEKCAQADPALREEFDEVGEHFKEAGGWDWLTKPLSNVGRAIGGAAETVGSTIGGVGAGIFGAGEAVTDAVGITDPATNTGFDTAGTMFSGAGAGAKNMGRSFGLEGLDATADHGEKNYFNDVHEGTMDQAGYTDKQKMVSRGLREGGREAANIAATFAVPGTALRMGRAGVGATRGAQGVAKLPAFMRGATTAAGRSARARLPVMTGAEKLLGPMGTSRQAFLNAPGLTGATTGLGRFAQGTGNVLGMADRSGARNLLLPMVGVEGAAGIPGTIAGATGAPQLTQGVGHTLKLFGKAPGLRWMTSPANKLVTLGGKTGKLPLGPLVLGADAADRVFDRGVNAVGNQAMPGVNLKPQDFSDETGLAAYARMPMKNRPLINGVEVQIPGAETWNNAIENGVDPHEAYKAAVEQFQRNAGAAPELGDFTHYTGTYRGRSTVGNMLPLVGAENLGKGVRSLYPDQSPPTIAHGDMSAAHDFMTPIEGLVAYKVRSHVMQTNPVVQRMISMNMEPHKIAEFVDATMQSPGQFNGEALSLFTRHNLLNELKGHIPPESHTSLLQAYAQQEIPVTNPTIDLFAQPQAAPPQAAE